MFRCAVILKKMYRAVHMCNPVFDKTISSQIKFS